MTTSSANSESNEAVFQNSLYIAITLQNILYGVELLLYFKTIHLLLNSGNACKRSTIFYACFSTVMVFSVTVWIATRAIFCEKMWSLNDKLLGDPDAYWKKNISVWYVDWETTMMVILQLMTDGLVIYRCGVLWDSYRLVIGPIVLWLTTLVLGIVVDWFTSTPGIDFFVGITAQLIPAYYAISVFLNIILTCMICFCILRHARKVQKHVGKGYASLYFGIVTVIVESVLPYTLAGIACLVLLGTGSPTSVVFISLYVLMMCISPQMLILRVIAGTAWDKDTRKSTSSPLKFSVGAMSTSPGFDNDASRTHLQPEPTSNADGCDKV